MPPSSPEKTLDDTRMLDYNDENVDIQISHDKTTGRSVVWVNVNGMCRLRAYNCASFRLMDDRK